MERRPVYVYKDEFGYPFTCTEHMLYPSEIARIYRIRKNNKLDIKGVEKLLDVYHKENNIMSKFYYETSRGNLRRVYPKSIYDSAIKKYREEKRNGV